MIGNSVYLISKILFNLIVTFYSSRIILSELGVVDFGIYNLVGGIALLLAFINGSMNSAVQRFFAFELGKKTYGNLKSIFQISFTVHILLSLFVFIIVEVLGWYLLRFTLDIPESRLFAAKMVLHSSVITLCITLITIPFTASLISTEKIKVFSLIGFLETFFKLIGAFLLTINLSFDKLIIYAFFSLIVKLVIFIIYVLYCNRNVFFVCIGFRAEVSKVKSIFSYVSWSLIENISVIINNQVINILVNVYFGAVINASRGIAFQVLSALSGFLSSIMLAISPRIIKYYSANKFDEMFKLAINGAKANFYIVYLIASPIFYNSEYLLKLWLNNPPQYSIVFVKLICVDVLLASLSGTLISMIQATGNIKNYQILVGGVLLLNFPISFIFISNGFEPQSVFYVTLCLTVIALICRLMLVRKMLGFPLINFIKDVLFPVLIVVVLGFFYQINFGINWPKSFLFYLKAYFPFLVFSLLSIWMLGLKNEEKYFLIAKILKKS